MGELIPVWPGTAPGSEAWTHQERESPAPWNPELRVVRNVVRPTLEPFLPASGGDGTAVVVCPGGGFHFLSIEMEGTDVARWLRERGAAAFVLRYRVAETPVDEGAFGELVRDLRSRREAMDAVRPFGVADAREALRLVRARADEWRVDPAKVGMVGFSAGGMVTAGLALDPDPANRPSFAGAIYGAPFAEVDVPADAPPLFQVVAADDFLVERCVDLDRAWRAAGRPAELHLYARGGHGFGMRRRALPTDGWIDRFWEWLRAEVPRSGAGRSDAPSPARG
jgi:acetyl esterase/lipase